jgi:hypothetical protein
MSPQFLATLSGVAPSWLPGVAQVYVPRCNDKVLAINKARREEVAKRYRAAMIGKELTGQQVADATGGRLSTVLTWMQRNLGTNVVRKDNPRGVAALWVWIGD